MVQWLRLCASTAGGTGSIPSQGTKIPHAMQWDLKFNFKLNYLLKSSKKKKNTDAQASVDQLSQNLQYGEFPGHPVVKTLCSQGRGHGFDL